MSLLLKNRFNPPPSSPVADDPRPDRDGPILILLPKALQSMATSGSFDFLNKWQGPIYISLCALSFAMADIVIAQGDDPGLKRYVEFHNDAAAALAKVMTSRLPDNIVVESALNLTDESMTYCTDENAYLRKGKNDPLPIPGSVGKTPLSLIDHERMAFQDIAACISRLQDEVPELELVVLHNNPPGDRQIIPERLGIDVSPFDAARIKPLGLMDFYKQVGAIPSIDLSSLGIRGL